MKQVAGQLAIAGMPDIAADAQLQTVAEQLADIFRVRAASGQAAVKVRLALDAAIAHPEGYRLQIAPGRIVISAATPAGAFYGTVTLRQLVEQSLQQTGAISLPLVTIEDYPRFAWRGLMMDVARHFFTADEVCRMLDVMALHKFNRFHWHLTDDQGWRLPVRKYPLLTEVGGVRRETAVGPDSTRPRQYDGIRHGGFYTAADIQRVVAHAAKLHITVVPEIDMPGHMQAAIAAYPQLGNLGWPIEVRTHWNISTHILNPFPATIAFMQDVLAEVAELFPGPYVHIGGDEAVKQQWSESKAVQQRMAELGLTSEDQLQSWFIHQMGQFLAGRGKRLLGWDEITEGGTPANAVVVGWRGTSHATKAAIAGHEVIMAPGTHTYFDHYQADPKTQPLAIGGLTTAEKAYAFDPVPAELPAAHHHRVLGGQGQLWSEYIATFDYLTYMAFPRACALAEALWLDGGQKNWPDFVRRLQQHKHLLLSRVNRIGPMPDVA